DFLTTTQDEWAKAHMAERYGALPPTDDDPPRSFPVLCFDHLKSEYHQLRAWFTEPDYKLSALLQSKFLGSEFSGPIGDGFGWDFRRDGDTEPRMIQFKSTLINCYRQLMVLPGRCRSPSNMVVTGLARIVRGAYQIRSEVHMWQSVEKRR